MAAKKEPVKFSIVNAPPELDFYFSLARGKRLNLSLQAQSGARKDLDVYIDGIIVLASVEEDRDEWEIRGRFYGDGVTNWQMYPFKDDGKKKVRYEYALWGSFKGGYNKRTRTGYIETWNYKINNYRHQMSL